VIRTPDLLIRSAEKGFTHANDMQKVPMKSRFCTLRVVAPCTSLGRGLGQTSDNLRHRYTTGRAPVPVLIGGKNGREQLIRNQMFRENPLPWLRFFGPVRELSETFAVP
jgi:hypothetical protein